MLGIHLVEHLGGEVRQRLAGGDRLDDVGDRLVASGHVVRRHCDRPLLTGCRLPPVGIAQLLEKSRGLLHLGLELLGKRFSLGSHGVLRGSLCGGWSRDRLCIEKRSSGSDKCDGIPYACCLNASFIAPWSSAGVRSLRRVANDQLWPKGSVTTP